MHKKNTSVADAVMQGFSDGACPSPRRSPLEFAVFDRWYTQLPGAELAEPHVFVQRDGGRETRRRLPLRKDVPYPQRTIFDALLDAGHEYVRIYKYVVPRVPCDAIAVHESWEHPSHRHRRIDASDASPRRRAIDATSLDAAPDSQDSITDTFMDRLRTPDAHHGPLLRRRRQGHAASINLDRPAPGY